MERKILAIFVSLLFLTTIPSVLGEIADSESDFRENNLDFDRVWMKGLLSRSNRFPPYRYLAIRLVVIYNISSNPQREVYWFKWITFRDSAYMGRRYEVGLGLSIFYIGYVEGLEIAP